MSKRTMYIHIGPHKTGTSSIQSFLSLNKSLLEKQNYLYPKSGLIFDGHHHLAKDVLEDADTPPLFGGLDDLQKEILGSNQDVIISSEDFDEIRTTHQLNKIKDKFEDDFDFKIIMFFRNQFELLLSY